MGKKTEVVQVKLPYKTLGAFEDLAKLAGVPTRDVILVCLALSVQAMQQGNTARGVAK